MGEKRGTEFIVLTSQRSGSTWLINMLNQLEDTTAYGELFLGRRRVLGRYPWESPDAYPRYSESKIRRLTVRPIAVVSYLKNLFRQPGNVGFKLMYTQLFRYPELLAYLVLNRVKVVHLIRENTLDVMISSAIRRQSAAPHLVDESARQEDIKVELNTASLLKRMRTRRKKIARARKLIDLTSLPHIEVTYEDLVRNPETFQKICEFLDINSGGKRPQSKLVKIRQKGQADIIKNYPEVKELLSTTPFASMLEDDGEKAEANVQPSSELS